MITIKLQNPRSNGIWYVLESMLQTIAMPEHLVDERGNPIPCRFLFDQGKKEIAVRLLTGAEEMKREREREKH